MGSQQTASKESRYPIFVASEQGLDTSVYKRVFKPPRLKSQICFIYLQEFCSLAAQKISRRDLGKRTEYVEVPGNEIL